MRYLSVCSGIEAATVAWHPLGWEAFAYSEIEAFPAAVLAHHYPNTPNFGDMTKFKEWPHAAIDLLVGGTPCQSFSVAGLRKGLDDPRGNLMLTYLAIAAKYRPSWLVWENVPGVLSSNGGRDFGTFLAGLGQLGYGFAYRVLDAQYFGVAQRRRRVFVIGCLGNWRAAAAVLFERASLSGHPAPSREAGQRVAATVSAGAPSRRNGGSNPAAGHFVAFGGNNCSGSIDVATAVNACASASGRMDFESETFIAHSLRGEGFDASEDGTGRGTPLVPVAIQAGALRENPNSGPDGIGVQEGIAYTLEARSEVQAVAQPYTLAIRGRGDSHDLEYRQDGTANALLTPNGGRGGIGVGAVAAPIAWSEELTPSVDVAGTIQRGGSGGRHDGVLHAMQVRRLTPRECERLQGFQWQCSPEYPGAWQDDSGIWWTPDYTLINYRGKPAADGPRYKALGNSMAVPVMHWIGRRIQVVSSIQFQRTAA